MERKGRVGFLQDGHRRLCYECGMHYRLSRVDANDRLIHIASIINYSRMGADFYLMTATYIVEWSEMDADDNLMDAESIFASILDSKMNSEVNLMDPDVHI